MEATDYDGAWKEILETLWRPFLEFCFPKVATAIDWTQPWAFLDQELQEVVRDAELGKQRVDKLVKVFRRDGVEEWLLVHVEVQSQKDPNLPRRMYQYQHRIADRYGRRVVGLAVLGDTSRNWQPSVYEEETWGCRLRYEFLVCKLLAFAAIPGLLEKSNNPVVMVIAAHLAAQSTAGDMSKRQAFKWNLVRRLYHGGFDRQAVMDLFRLLDWLLVLPKELEVAFRARLLEYEEETRMPHITSIERLSREEGQQEGWRKGRHEGWQEGRHEGQQEGRHEGRQEGRQEDILDALAARFGEVPSDLRQQIKAVSDETRLKGLLRQAVIQPTLDTFRAYCQADLA